MMFKCFFFGCFWRWVMSVRADVPNVIEDLIKREKTLNCFVEDCELTYCQINKDYSKL